MRATRKSRSQVRRSALRKRASRRRASRPAARRVAHHGHAAPEFTLYRVCKPGWAVMVEKTPNSLGTRFVCPFCPQSHRVPGPVRGFKKMRRAQWIKLRRVSE